LYRFGNIDCPTYPYFTEETLATTLAHSRTDFFATERRLSPNIFESLPEVPQFENGDRVTLDMTALPDTLALPQYFWEATESFWYETTSLVLLDSDDQPIEADFDPLESTVFIPKLSERIGNQWFLLFLEAIRPGVFRLNIFKKQTPFSLSDHEEEKLLTEGGHTIYSDPADWAFLLGPRQQAANLREFSLALAATDLATHGGFDRLISLPLVRDMEILEHQTRTAKMVLGQFRGRAMLCDEVGLGKTIEAGMILSELVMRGLAQSVLILTPPSLVEQWQGELRRKFSLDFLSYDAPTFGKNGWAEQSRIIASIHTAKRDPHKAAILSRKWDMVIVDEAHHLRNRNTMTWKFAAEIRKQYILLLTATPVQNNLDELFNLVTLLEPGLLSTSKQFQNRFVDKKDKLAPKNIEQLHSLLAEVMVRNRRSTVGLRFTRRWAKSESVAPTEEERSLYHDVTTLIRNRLHEEQGTKGLNRMALISLQMALGSSPQAAAGTLRKLSEQPKLSREQQRELVILAERAEAIRENAKVNRLLTLLGEFSDKIVIFTKFLATQQMLVRRLEEAGHSVSVFHGGLNRLEKERAVEAFRGPARILLATEAGSEGRNLQFAHVLCNFDLPWNPMKIEQRIGRLSRIGQLNDVHVYNLVAADTVEAAVLHLLDAKLSMFELVIGEIDMILGNMEDEREFEDVIADIWTDSHNTTDFAKRMDELGNRLIAAKEAYLAQRSRDDKLFGNHFAPKD